MTPLVVENEPPVTFLRRKMTGGRFSMGVVIRRYTGITPMKDSPLSGHVLEPGDQPSAYEADVLTIAPRIWFDGVHLR